jgi:hypothetical protein
MDGCVLFWWWSVPPATAGGEAPGDFIVSVWAVGIGKIKASFMLLFFFKSYFQPLNTGTST